MEKQADLVAYCKNKNIMVFCLPKLHYALNYFWQFVSTKRIQIIPILN